MHRTEVRKEIVERVLARRGTYHIFESFDPSRTAHLVIDMQNTFVAPGSPAEVPVARGIVGPLNALNAALRDLGVRIFWVTHANSNHAGDSDWPTFFDYFVAEDVRARTIQSLDPNGDGQQI